jgi:hypothetical protein
MKPLGRSSALRAFIFSHAIAIVALTLPLVVVLAAHAVERALAALTTGDCAAANACLD